MFLSYIQKLIQVVKNRKLSKILFPTGKQNSSPASLKEIPRYSSVNLLIVKSSIIDSSSKLNLRYYSCHTILQIIFRICIKHKIYKI